MDKIIEIIKQIAKTDNETICMAMFVVLCLIVVFALVGIVISIILFAKYHKLNKTKNSCGLTGEQAARKILDDNGLQHIKIKVTGSIMWGNSYSHYFKKLRLRRLTYKKDSVTSLAMAAQKSSLAVMDKEKDPIMKTRNILIPIQFFGPMMFLPMIVVGVILDIIISTNPELLFTFIFAGLGVGFYAVTFVLTAVILKAETKAQAKSIEILRAEHLATESEIESIKGLYKMYNLEYVNNMILAFLELLLRVLQIVAAAQGHSSATTSSN